MSTDYKNIFTQSPCLTNDELINYVSGNLSVADIRKVELHIADCQMCNDELEGLQILNDNKKLPLIITSLNNKIDSYFNKKEVSIPTINEEKKTFNLKKTFSIAASIALLITAGYFIYDINNNVSSENIAEANIPESPVQKNENIVIETSKPEKTIEEKNKVTTLNNEDEKTSSNNENNSLKEDNNATIIEAEASNELSEEINTNEEIAEVLEEPTNIAVTNDVDDTNTVETAEIEESKSSENNSPIFGATRGTDMLRKKKVNKDYKYLKDSGLLSFNIKSYNDAISDFNKYLQHNPNDFEVVFKTGMSYYYIKNYNAAISKFNKITSSQKYFEDAQWYKANALLKQNKKDDALTTLNEIVKNAGKYSEKAKAKILEISN